MHTYVLYKEKERKKEGTKERERMIAIGLRKRLDTQHSLCYLL